MTKTITRIGNSQGLIFDAALMDLARIKVGDQVSISVHMADFSPADLFVVE
jgi:antitoxin component of MazEF toxin-antitoxin module